MSSGGTKQSRLKILDKQIAEEEAAWAANELEIERVNLKMFPMYCKILATERLMVEHLKISQDDRDLALKEVWLEELKELRSMIQPQMEEAKAAFERAQLEAKLGLENGQAGRPRIVGIDGKPINPEK